MDDNRWAKADVAMAWVARYCNEITVTCSKDGFGPAPLTHHSAWQSARGPNRPAPRYKNHAFEQIMTESGKCNHKRCDRKVFITFRRLAQKNHASARIIGVDEADEMKTVQAYGLWGASLSPACAEPVQALLARATTEKLRRGHISTGAADRG